MLNYRASAAVLPAAPISPSFILAWPPSARASAVATILFIHGAQTPPARPLAPSLKLGGTSVRAKRTTRRRPRGTGGWIRQFIRRFITPGGFFPSDGPGPDSRAPDYFDPARAATKVSRRDYALKSGGVADAAPTDGRGAARKPALRRGSDCADGGWLELSLRGCGDWLPLD